MTARFASATLTDALRFRLDSTDGLDESDVCLGGLLHIRLLEPLWPEKRPSVTVLGNCDGSCREPRTDLSELINGLIKQFQLENGRVVDDRLHIDGSTRAALKLDSPFIGREFSGSYCKRDGKSVRVCTGERHVEIDTDFSWWSGRDASVGQTHKVTSTPCDGSCSQRVRFPKAILKRIWREIARHSGL